MQRPETITIKAAKRRIMQLANIARTVSREQPDLAWKSAVTFYAVFILMGMEAYTVGESGSFNSISPEVMRSLLEESEVAMFDSRYLLKFQSLCRWMADIDEYDSYVREASAAINACSTDEELWDAAKRIHIDALNRGWRLAHSGEFPYKDTVQ